MNTALFYKRLVEAYETPEARRQVVTGMVQGVRTVLMALGVILLAVLYYQKQPARLTWSWTPSIAVGLYTYKLDDVFDLKRTSLVRYRYTAPQWVRDRHWTHKPDTEWHLKRLVGIPGDRIEMHGNEVWLCERQGETELPCEKVAKRIAFDRNGVEWPPVSMEGVIPADHFLALGDHPLSFDSRYFGLIRRDQIIGTAQALWVEDMDPSVLTKDWEAVLRREFEAARQAKEDAR